MWVLDYQEDIDSDMSVFHRVDDPAALPGPVYFARAERLPAYGGVLRARVLAEAKRKGNSGQHLSDGVALDRLANEGWLDREGSAP